MFLVIKIDVSIDLLEILLTFAGVGDVSFRYKSFPPIGVFLEIV